MSVYEALTLMVAFGVLIVAIMNSNNKDNKKTTHKLEPLD